MEHTCKSATICLAVIVLVFATATNSLANSGSVVFSVDVDGTPERFDMGIHYTIQGIDDWTGIEGGWIDSGGYGVINAPMVTVSGTFRILAPAKTQNKYSAEVIFSTEDYDLLDGFPKSGICEGSPWEWSGSINNSAEEGVISDDVPFSVSMPVPKYDEASGITNLNFSVGLYREWMHPILVNPIRDYCFLNGVLEIPVGMKPKPPTALSISNGGKLDPLRISFSLMDNSTKPPKPLANKVIKVSAPIPGKPADAEMNSEGNPKWKLSGYFMSKTECPNCNWKQATSMYTSEIYYYLKEPGQPIEVLTDEYGNAELLFFLNSPSLLGHVPTREFGMDVSIQAEYIATEGDSKGESLAKGKFVTTLNHIGYIVDVTYVQPQEWDDPVGKFGDYTLAGHNPAEYPLDSYFKDTGSGVPYDDVRGSDRATFEVYLSDQGVSDEYGVAGGTPSLGTGANVQAEILKAGMLFAPGDKINLDARGMVRYKPVNPQSPESQFRGKAGWIWVQVKFFDGLKAKAGVNGICGKHTLTFGSDPYKSGWKTPGWTFMWWAAKEGVDFGISYFKPLYGQIDMISDVAGYIKWFNGDIPIYVRLRSEVAITHSEDGSSLLVVREGQPDVVTEQTGLTGVKVAAGQSAEISSNSQVRVVATNREQAAYADKLLAGLGNLNDDASRLTPIEPGGRPSTVPTSVDWEDEAGDVPVYEDEAGDVPLTGTGIDGIESISPPEADTWDTRYYFDEFSMGFWNGWDYSPDSGDGFASLSHDEIPLYIVIVREEVSSEAVLGFMELESGYTDSMVLGGRDAVIHALLENGEEFGFLLSFDEPLRSGKNLHLMFFSDAEYIDEGSDLMVQILLGMRFD